MEPVLTALPLDLMGEVGQRFAAFADHRVETVKTWCRRLVDGSKGAAEQIKDLEVSLAIGVVTLGSSAHGMASSPACVYLSAAAMHGGHACCP